MLGIGKTDMGRVRANNEDSVLINNQPVGVLPNLFVVADGMGGHKAGEVASSLAIKYCCEYLTSPSQERGELLDSLADSVYYANSKVYEVSLQDSECSNMGTTFTGCSIKDNRAYIVHVGDSRLYKITRDSIEQITMDHSFVAEMVRAGKLTPEEAEVHPDRNIITRALGTDPQVKIDGFVINLTEDDVLLICSDGLNTMLDDDLIFKILSQKDVSPEDKLNTLIETANNNGGTDNISVILIYLKGGDSV